ncbi:hypothetical protein VNO80_18317 [Phaseolus coccineus]|uniref:Uncharacterized protein n=1 Tax=Phaseolus coccineus TaxID=3886 RepID=A0AAN9MF43_PHACN
MHLFLSMNEKAGVDCKLGFNIVYIYIYIYMLIQYFYVILTSFFSQTFFIFGLFRRKFLAMCGQLKHLYASSWKTQRLVGSTGTKHVRVIYVQRHTGREVRFGWEDSDTDNVVSNYTSE